jgi:hypothetical protein
MTRFITIPPFALPRFTWLVYLLLLGAPHPRQPENIAQQRARQAACSTTYHGYENLFHKAESWNLVLRKVRCDASKTLHSLKSPGLVRVDPLASFIVNANHSIM